MRDVPVNTEWNGSSLASMSHSEGCYLSSRRSFSSACARPRLRCIARLLDRGDVLASARFVSAFTLKSCQYSYQYNDSGTHVTERVALFPPSSLQPLSVLCSSPVFPARQACPAPLDLDKPN